jgi:hypothetical protein
MTSLRRRFWSYRAGAFLRGAPAPKTSWAAPHPIAFHWGAAFSLCRGPGPVGPGLRPPAQAVGYPEQHSSSKKAGKYEPRPSNSSRGFAHDYHGPQPGQLAGGASGKERGIDSTQKEANKPESPAKLAEHDVTKKKRCQIASQGATCYGVSTDATSGEAFTAFTRHFSKQSGGDDNVVVIFFFDELQANSSGRGFAFESKEAARDILSRVLPQQRVLRGADLNEGLPQQLTGPL